MYICTQVASSSVAFPCNRTKHAPPRFLLPRSFRHCCHHQKSRELYYATRCLSGSRSPPESCHSQSVLHVPTSHLPLDLPSEVPCHLLAAAAAVVTFHLHTRPSGEHIGSPLLPSSHAPGNYKLPHPSSPVVTRLAHEDILLPGCSPSPKLIPSLPHATTYTHYIPPRAHLLSTC